MDNQQPPVTPESTPDPIGQTPEQIETPAPQAATQPAQVSNETVPDPTATPQPDASTIAPDILLQKFLQGDSIEAHKPIHLEISPLQVKQVEGGGVIVTPSSNLLVKYEGQ